MNQNSKYYIIKDKDIAVTIETLTGQHPYAYENKYEKGKFVYSFINDEKFKEIFKLVMELLHKNGR
ncbi:hypothetical protein [Clostridium saudiense]|uniref:hypothetical protein n=1 Tax=Clostridium saudiense TaxID=1414720 RepID=UPI0026DD6EAF|nr:hypothetical protein [uncultured Clostridium sp.]